MDLNQAARVVENGMISSVSRSEDSHHNTMHFEVRSILEALSAGSNYPLPPSAAGQGEGVRTAREHPIIPLFVMRPPYLDNSID